MKKLLSLLLIIICLTGCTNIKKASVDSIINETIQSKAKLSNQYRTGFKYYLPANLESIKSERANEVLTNGKDKYYLYVDLISYLDNAGFIHVKNENAYYSKAINYNNKEGYVEIYVNKDKYLIEIMYNYAKIEVIVDNNDLNEAVANSLIVLSSIDYNPHIIRNLLGDDILNYSEEKFSIFDDNNKDSNFLEYVQEYDNYNDTKSNEIPDYDLIN